MINSMTGFGRSQKLIDQTEYTLMIKSVNHRYLDIRCRLPLNLQPVEIKFIQAVKEKISRGRIDIFLNLSTNSPKKSNPVLNKEMAGQYLQIISQLSDVMVNKGFGHRGECPGHGKNRERIPGPIDLMHLEGVLQYEEPESSNLDGHLVKLLDQALVQIKESRRREGELLSKDFKFHLQEMKEKVGQIIGMAQSFEQEAAKKVRTTLEKFNLPAIDQDRLMQEVAHLVSRTDINEEVVRLESHLQQFEDTLNINGPMGKKLDFIIQEMVREANTIGAKTDQLPVKNILFEIKVLLEKLREQGQNVE